jgi:hypothetical protein
MPSGSFACAIASMIFGASAALRASFSCISHSCWQVQRRAVTSTASSSSAGGSLLFQRSCSPSAWMRRASSG